MKLAFIEHDKLFVDKTNMRYAKKAPDVTDLLPTVRKRGVIIPLIVRPANDDDRSGIVAGSRRWTANGIVLAEGIDHGPLPCAILEDGDDAAAIEASLIENIARLDPDEVTQWETFVRLVKEGRLPEDISETFGIPEMMVKRVLALGNLLPRIRDLYRKEKIDRATVRHLTVASKSQQKAWLALYDDAEAYCPTGRQLRDWLLGGASIKVEHALFDVEKAKVSIIADLFEKDRLFADAEAFWEAQEAAIEERRETYMDEGWPDAVALPRGEYFHSWEYRKAPKRKGGRVYIETRHTGEVVFHEGYVTAKEAQRLERGEAIDTGPKAPRPEVTSTMQTYIDLHRHAAVRAALCRRPKIALRLMVAHAIVGARYWKVEPEPQTCRNADVRESVETCKGETDFDVKRRAVLDLLNFSPEEPTVTGGNSDDYGLTGLFLALLTLSDHAVMQVIAVVMGETLAAGTAAVEAVGGEIGVDMARYWQADDAFFEVLRDKEVLTRIVAEVADEAIASANAKETGKVLKRIVRDHLDGANGRPKVSGWVPKWMAFPPAAYTTRGGVDSVDAAALVAAARAFGKEPEPTGPARCWRCPHRPSPSRSRNRSAKRRETGRAAACPPPVPFLKSGRAAWRRGNPRRIVMADYWTQGAFAFRCTKAECALLAEAFPAARELGSGIPREPSPALFAAFPPNDAEDRWSGFRALFPDPDFPHLGASFIPDNVPDDPASAEVSIFGDQDFQPEAIAALIQLCCPTTLAAGPIGFEWADSCSAPRVDAFGGGWCAIFADRIEFGATGEALDRALAGT